MCLKLEHYIILAISLVVIFVLWKWSRIDNFDVIQQYPFLPPNDWKATSARKWTPWYYQENELSYHQSVPSILNYGTDFYRFPTTNCLKNMQHGPMESPLLDNISPCYKPANTYPAPPSLVGSELPYEVKMMNSVTGIDGSKIEGFDPEGPTIGTIGCGGCMVKPPVLAEADYDSNYGTSCMNLQ